MTMDRILPVGGLGPKAGTDTSAAPVRPRHPWHDEAMNIATRAATTPQAQAREITVQEAAEVLLAKMKGREIDPFDATNPDIEAMAARFAGNRGDGVMQLEIAETFFRAALRAIAAMQKGR